MATSNLRFRIIGDDDASGAFLKVAASAKLLNSTFSDLGQNALGLTKLIGGAGLLPVLAATTGVTLELGTALGAAAGAAGIFGVSAVGIFSDMLKAQKAITVTTASLAKLTPGTADYAAKLKELHNQQSAFNQTFGPAAKGYNSLQNAFAKFKSSTSDVTTSVLGKGMQLLASVLPRLVPISNAAGKAIGGLLDDLSKWTKSPSFQGLLDWFQKSGPAAITHFGHSVGHILTGLGGILKNFIGPGDKAAGSLQRLTKRFSEWGNSKGVSDSVDKFLRYINGNSGNISSVFASLAQTAPKMATALGGLGSVNLAAISMFLNLLATMPQGVFDVVVKGLFGIALASKAISIYSGLAAIITGLSGALTILGDAAIGTRLGLMGVWIQEALVATWSAVSAGAMALLDVAMDANPIGLVVLAIAALVAGLIIAWKHSATFRFIVEATFHAIGVAGKWMWENVLKPDLNLLVGALQVVGKWAIWLWNNAFQPTVKFIVAGIGFMLGIWGKMLSALGHVPGFGWAKTAGDLMNQAADAASHLADHIEKIPTHKSVTVDIIRVVHGVVHTTGGHVPSDSGGGSGGGSSSGMVMGGGSRGGHLGHISIDVTSDGKVIQRKLLRLQRTSGVSLGFV